MREFGFLASDCFSPDLANYDNLIIPVCWDMVQVSRLLLPFTYASVEGYSSPRCVLVFLTSRRDLVSP